MELARLASNKQASKQHASSTGPLLVRREGVPKSKESITTLSGIIFRNFLGNNFFRSDPQGVAKGYLLGVWPVLGRGHLEKFWARVKNGKTQFPGARGTFGEKIRQPQKFLPKIAHFFYILGFGRPAPQGREIAKYWFCSKWSPSPVANG